MTEAPNNTTAFSTRADADCKPVKVDRRGNDGMTNDVKTVDEALHRIYQKHRRKYRENGDSKQMCCMWSTDDPPDIIEGTPPFDDIEAAFDLAIDEDAAMELYDMNLDEAAARILDMRRLQSGSGQGKR